MALLIRILKILKLEQKIQLNHIFKLERENVELSCAAGGKIQRLWDVCEQQRKYTNTNKFKIVQMNTRRIFGAEVVDSGGVSLCGEILALATQVGGEIVKLCIV